MAPEADVQPIDPDVVVDNINAVVKESKTGYKTTEFWITVVVSILALVQAYPVPDYVNGIIAAVAAGAYAVSRGLAKQGVPDVEPLPPAS